jgi:hypothetical protein
MHLGGDAPPKLRAPEAMASQIHYTKQVSSMDRKHQNVKTLAYLWRYGWIAPLFIGVPLLGAYIGGYMAFAILLLLYGLYTLIIAMKGCEHFYCGMQQTYREEMTPYHDHKPEWLRKARSDGVIMSAVLCVLAVFMAIAGS